MTSLRGVGESSPFRTAWYWAGRCRLSKGRGDFNIGEIVEHLLHSPGDRRVVPVISNPIAVAVPPAPTCLGFLLGVVPDPIARVLAHRLVAYGRQPAAGIDAEQFILDGAQRKQRLAQGESKLGAPP